MRAKRRYQDPVRDRASIPRDAAYTVFMASQEYNDRKRAAPSYKAKRVGAAPCPAMNVRGTPCGTHCARVTLRGKKYQLKTCIFHSSQAIKKELGMLDPPLGNVGRKKTPTANGILRERFEAEADRYLQPLEDAIIAVKAVVVGNGGSAHLEFTEDFALRLRALEVLLDRIYGRPKQVTEITGADGEAIAVEVPTDTERQAALAAVLVSTGALGTPKALIPANSSAAAPTTN